MNEKNPVNLSTNNFNTLAFLPAFPGKKFKLRKAHDREKIKNTQTKTEHKILLYTENFQFVIFLMNFSAEESTSNPTQ